MTRFRVDLVLDCADVKALAPFWAEALHYRARLDTRKELRQIRLRSSDVDPHASIPSSWPTLVNQRRYQ